MIFPKKLQRGDTVALVSPASPSSSEVISGCEKFLTDLGYQVKLGEAVAKQLDFHNYVAGSAKIRANDINRMFADPEISAIFCTRGGYGSAHIMKYLDLDLIKSNPKVFIGYSDLTNLHTYLNQLCGMVTFHGPMVYPNMLLHYEAYTQNSLNAALRMEDVLEFLNPPTDKNFQVLNEGNAYGQIVGGNLSLLAQGIGSFYQLDTKDKILLLEDVEEPIPKLDMMITQLEYAGMMEQVNGILLGDFASCTNERYDSSYELDDFLHDRFQDYEVPILSHVHSDHSHPMGTIPMGCDCKMDTDTKKILFYRPS